MQNAELTMNQNLNHLFLSNPEAYPSNLCFNKSMNALLFMEVQPQ